MLHLISSVILFNIFIISLRYSHYPFAYTMLISAIFTISAHFITFLFLNSSEFPNRSLLLCLSHSFLHWHGTSGGLQVRHFGNILLLLSFIFYKSPFVILLIHFLIIYRGLLNQIHSLLFPYK